VFFITKPSNPLVHKITFLDVIKKSAAIVVAFVSGFFSTMSVWQLVAFVVMQLTGVFSYMLNSKYVQTDSKVYPLKYFFSEGMVTESGDDVSTKEVKKTLKEFIDQEDKKKPLSDEKLEKMLHEKGYIIARRTVAKYREQLGIPVARLRKNM
jgi:hypothetical protein